MKGGVCNGVPGQRAGPPSSNVANAQQGSGEREHRRTPRQADAERTGETKERPEQRNGARGREQERNGNVRRTYGMGTDNVGRTCRTGNGQRRTDLSNGKRTTSDGRVKRGTDSIGRTCQTRNGQRRTDVPTRNNREQDRTRDERTLRTEGRAERYKHTPETGAGEQLESRMPETGERAELLEKLLGAGGMAPDTRRRELAVGKYFSLLEARRWTGSNKGSMRTKGVCGQREYAIRNSSYSSVCLWVSSFSIHSYNLLHCPRLNFHRTATCVEPDSLHKRIYIQTVITIQQVMSPVP